MTSEPMRDPRPDPLSAPTSSALKLSGYHAKQIKAKSIDADLLVRNVVSTALLVRKIVSVVRSGEVVALLSYGRR